MPYSILHWAPKCRTLSYIELQSAVLCLTLSSKVPYSILHWAPKCRTLSYIKLQSAVLCLTLSSKVPYSVLHWAPECCTVYNSAVIQPYSANGTASRYHIMFNKFFLRKLFFIIAPFPDSACRIWDSDCGEKGNCWLYDSDQFRIAIHSFAGGESYSTRTSSGSQYIHLSAMSPTRLVSAEIRVLLRPQSKNGTKTHVKDTRIHFLNDCYYSN